MDTKKPFVIDFDLIEGYCKSGIVKPISRYVSNMVSQFADSAAAVTGEEPAAAGGVRCGGAVAVSARHAAVLRAGRRRRFFQQPDGTAAV